MESDRGLCWFTTKDGGRDGTPSKGFGGEGACLYFRGGTDGMAVKEALELGLY